MANVYSLAFKLLGIALGFTAVIISIYVFIIPMYFNGYKTYSFLIIGASFTAVLSGYYCYKVMNAIIPIYVKCLLASFCGIVVAALVVLCAMFIILNIKGT
jgi:hypothetical protein